VLIILKKHEVWNQPLKTRGQTSIFFRVRAAFILYSIFFILWHESGGHVTVTDGDCRILYTIMNMSSHNSYSSYGKSDPHIVYLHESFRCPACVHVLFLEPLGNNISYSNLSTRKRAREDSKGKYLCAPICNFSHNARLFYIYTKIIPYKMTNIFLSFKSYEDYCLRFQDADDLKAKGWNCQFTIFSFSLGWFWWIPSKILHLGSISCI
jgi:hypothetical protein